MKNRIQILLMIAVFAFGIGSASATAILDLNVDQLLNVNPAGMTMGGSYQSGGSAAGGGGYPADIFVRGGFNDWGIDDAMTFDGVSIYSVDIEIEAGAWEFKIASDDWATVDLGAGAGDALVDIDVPRLIGTGAFGNLILDIAMGGLYNFTLDISSGLDTPTLIVSAVTAVSEPATVALLGLVMFGFLLARLRQQR